MIKLKAMSVLRNGKLRVMNPWDEALVSQVFGENADRLRSEMNVKLRDAPKFEIPPTGLIKIVKEYERFLDLPQSALHP